MINRLISATLAILLVGGCGALALAASGGRSNGGNAAVSQYQGVKGVHAAGGKHASGGGGGSGGQGGSGPVETASTGPAAAAGGLPFTGFDALGLAGIGLLLLLAGAAQRRFGAGTRRG